jgi:HPr kinase/phosphorylase
MYAQEGIQPEGVTVEEFALAPQVGLDFEILSGTAGYAKRIRISRIQKLGMALAGFTDYIHSDRVQLLGGSEMNYLNILDAAARRESIHRLQRVKISCMVITKGLDAPPELTEMARARDFALLKTPALSSTSIEKITDYLEMRLASRTTLHGVFMEVFGLGILILGASGIGKSECALELIVKGHRLVADDSVEIIRRGADRLVGAGGPVLKYHMELRGLGIIDIKELFGISATGNPHALELVVRLERWKPDGVYDRLGIDCSTMEILGVPVPLIEMPVAPGRNVSTLVEVAARAQLLRRRGFQLSGELKDERDPAGDGAP